MCDSVREHGRTDVRSVAIFLLIALGYFYCSVQRVSAGVVLPKMGETYRFSAALVGFLSSLFFYSYGFLQNVWGTISDRVGPLRSCATGLAIAGVGSLVILASHHPVAIGLSRVVTGLGLAALFTGIYLYAALAFPVAQYPFWVGCILVIGNLGTAAAVAPLGMLMDRVGYDGLYLALAGVAFVVSFVLWLLRGAAPPQTQRQEQTGAQPGAAAAGLRLMADDIAHGMRLVAQTRARWVIIAVWAILSAAVLALQGLWGVSWLMVSSGADEQTARFWVTCVSLGLVAGSPLGARITARCGGDRGGIVRIMILLSLAWFFYIAGAFFRVPAAWMGALGLWVGTASGAGMVYCSSTIKSLVPLSRAGLVIGTGQLFVYAAVILFQWGSGLIINNFPGAEPGKYLNLGYIVGFGAMAVCVWISLLLLFGVKSFRSEEEEPLAD